MKPFLEFLNAVEEFAFYVARRKVKDQGRRGKGIRSKPEMTLAEGLDGNPREALKARVLLREWFSGKILRCSPMAKSDS